jgi:predicted SAM-dependent methyltransferase
MSETARHRDKTARYCQGNGVDLGSGGDPVVPTAVQVDLPKPYGNELRTGGKASIQLHGDATNLIWFKDECMDYCYSSHLLEDFADWTPILKEWCRIIKPGGYLVLLIPDKQRFAEAVKRGQPGNPAHKHEGRPGELTEHIRKIGRFQIIIDNFAEPHSNDYNILFVAQKLSKNTQKII